MALKKSSKRIVISDESVNSFGFRTLTAGIDTKQYNNNPLMLWMHFRPTKGTKDEVLPLGIVTDLKVENGTLTGQPEFDDTDEFAMKLYEKFEAGILRMSSPGLLPEQFSSDKKLLLPNQKLATLVKSQLKEVSLADIGSNDNALSYADIVLYDKADHVIDLNDSKSLLTLTQNLNTNKNNMELEQINLADVAPLLGLSDKATSKEVTGAIEKLKTDKEAAEAKLADNIKLQDAAKITALVDDAFDKKKITAEQKENFTKLAQGNFEVAKATLDSMKPYVSLASQVNDANTTADTLEVADLVKLSAMELWRTGKLEVLKLKSFEQFKLKYKELNNRDYTGDK